MATETIGIIAGNGVLPLICAREARARGLRVVALAHRGETDSEIEKVVDKCEWIKLGQLGKIIRTLRGAGVSRALFVGGISRIRNFTRVKLDLRGALVAARLIGRKDDALLREIAAEIEKDGITIFGVQELIPSLVAERGYLTSRALTDREKKDATVGWEVCAELGRRDVGQAVVVHLGVVVALEAIEGTDAMLRRAGELIGGEGGVAIKRVKVQQDRRIDLPTIGPATIATMQAAGLRVLVVEAGATIIIEPATVAAEANRLGISVVVIGQPSEL